MSAPPPPPEASPTKKPTIPIPPTPITPLQAPGPPAPAGPNAAVGAVLQTLQQGATPPPPPVNVQHPVAASRLYPYRMGGISFLHSDQLRTRLAADQDLHVNNHQVIQETVAALTALPDGVGPAVQARDEEWRQVYDLQRQEISTYVQQVQQYDQQVQAILSLLRHAFNTSAMTDLFALARQLAPADPTHDLLGLTAGLSIKDDEVKKKEEDEKE